jgi:hypothetical protein
VGPVDELLRQSDLTRLLRVSRTTLPMWRKQGLMPASIALGRLRDNAVVYGREPEFEEPTVIAPSIEAFAALMGDVAMRRTTDAIVGPLVWGA